MIKTLTIIIATVFSLLAIGVDSVANTLIPYESYTYSYYRTHQYVPAPAPYITVMKTGFSNQGISLNDPQDIFITDSGEIYLLDTGNNRIIEFSPDWELENIIDSFENSGIKDTFNGPRGIYVLEDSIYVADTLNNRVIELDKNGNLIRETGAPKSDVIPADFTFFPVKIAVSTSKRIYIVSRNVFEGLIELDNEGNFFAYTGGNRVTYNPIELLWRRILTREQIEQMALFIPVEYTNLSICSNGFIFTVSAAGQVNSPIKRLNSAGVDVLQWDGYIRPQGDQLYNQIGGISGPSAFVDIDIDQYGIYRALDSKRGRIFTYNSRGNLLFAFGGIGSQEGTFTNPVAIASKGEQVVVLEGRTGQVSVFEPTEFGRNVIEGVVHYQNGRYEDSNEAWEKVLTHNTNYELAYINIGRSQLRQEMYAEALENFKLGHDRVYYSRTFRRYRNILIKEYFPRVVTIVAILAFAFFIYKKIKKRQNFESKEI